MLNPIYKNLTMRLKPGQQKFRTAYLRGRAAAKQNLPRESCPYADPGKRRYPTFAKAMRRLWLEGWDDMDGAKRKQAGWRRGKMYA